MVFSWAPHQCIQLHTIHPHPVVLPSASNAKHEQTRRYSQYLYMFSNCIPCSGWCDHLFIILSSKLEIQKSLTGLVFLTTLPSSQSPLILRLLVKQFQYLLSVLCYSLSSRPPYLLHGLLEEPHNQCACVQPPPWESYQILHKTVRAIWNVIPIMLPLASSCLQNKLKLHYVANKQEWPYLSSVSQVFPLL